MGVPKSGAVINSTRALPAPISGKIVHQTARKAVRALPASGLKAQKALRPSLLCRQQLERALKMAVGI